jgi:thymidylate kinase
VVTLLWAVRWKLHLRSQRPLLVSVSGCDGAGKTVHVDRLAAAFDACDVRRRVVWARGASSRFVAPLLWIGKRLAPGPRGDAGDAGGKATQDGEAERFRRRRAALSRPLARRAFAFVFALDLAWTYGVLTRARLLAGEVVICDRYVYDALVDYTLFTGVALDAFSWPLRWLERISPRPHVRLLLDVDPEEALRRKPEEGDAAHLAAARDAFARIAASRGLDTLPADEGIEEIQRRIARLALDAFYERYGTLLNALLWSNPSQLNPRPGVR